MLKSREILIYLYCIKYNFSWNDAYEDIKNKVDLNEQEQEKIAQKVKEYEKTHRCITLVDEDYPNQLKQILKPPFVIVAGIV